MAIDERQLKPITEQPPTPQAPAATREVSLPIGGMTCASCVRREEATLPIGGMTCASCVRRVERALLKVPGVESASVNLATERATVSFYPGAATREDLRAAVTRAGYEVREIPAA